MPPKPRPSPSDHAKDHKGERMKGNDGNMYISKADKNGVYRWIKESNKSSVEKQSKPKPQPPKVNSAPKPTVPASSTTASLPNIDESELKKRKNILRKYLSDFDEDVHYSGTIIIDKFKTKWGPKVSLQTKVNDVVKQLRTNSLLNPSDLQKLEQNFRDYVGVYTKREPADLVADFLDSISGMIAFSREISKLMKGIPVPSKQLKKIVDMDGASDGQLPPKLVLTDFHLLPEIFIWYKFDYEPSLTNRKDDPIFETQSDLEEYLYYQLKDAVNLINRALRSVKQQ